jgi:hypothetical protein
MHSGNEAFMADPQTPSDLGALYAQTMRRRDTSGAGHIDDATWETFAGDSHYVLDEQAVRHLVECANCASVYRAIDALRREASAFDPQAPTAGARTAVWLWAGLAAAAVIALAVVLPLNAPTSTPGSGNVVRGTLSATLKAIEPSGAISGVPHAFRWQSSSEAELYRVHLFTDEGMWLWTSAPVSSTEVAWPSSIEPRSGGYLWRVDGIRDGATVTGSPMLPFRIR